MDNTHPVKTAVGTFEVYFVNGTNACVRTPNNATVTVGKGNYTANVNFTRNSDGGWTQVTDGQAKPTISREYPDLRPVPPTIFAKIADASGIALRAIMEDNPTAPDGAEIVYAERATQNAQQAVNKARAELAEAEKKLAQAQQRLQTAIRDCGVGFSYRRVPTT